MIPTSTHATIAVKNKVPDDAEAIAAFVVQDEKSSSPETAALLGAVPAKSINRLLTSRASRGHAREVSFDLLEVDGKLKRVYAVGLGKSDKLSPEAIRIAAGALTKALRKHQVANVAVALPAASALSAVEVAEAVASGIFLASFDYEEYKGTAHKNKDKDDQPKDLVVTLISDDQSLASVKTSLDRTRIICQGQNFARTIASRPANNINPPSLAKVAQEMAREAGLTYSALDEKQMAKLGMGGILAVGSGSIATPPRMIVLEHKPAKLPKSSPTLLVVGKAITFDTGGISIKPADKMGQMIFDKCGGMTVMGLMYAVAKLKLPVHVVGILSSAENAISSKSYRPGDILKMYNGVTVEVTNTDAEGRLVLGDALAWGIETYKPAAVVDLATLTGGVIVALGKTMAGVMSNSDGLVKELEAAGEPSGEKIWRLPVGEDQRQFIKSDCADIVNSAGREGSPLQGGAFLSYFIPSDPLVPWAHLDIAGVADTEKELPYYANGATGWGVRLLVNWVTSRSK